MIHPTAIIYPGVEFEDENTVEIGPYCIIGAPAEWKGKESRYGVWIGSNVIITGLVTIDAGVEDRTFIFSQVFIMKHAHIGHDAIIDQGVTISCGAKIGGHAKIGLRANIGLNAVVHQRCKVPEYCMIGASAFVGKKSVLRPGYKYAGVPVKEIGPNERSNNIP